jgi:hypothetical protein
MDKLKSLFKKLKEKASDKPATNGTKTDTTTAAAVPEPTKTDTAAAPAAGEHALALPMTPQRLFAL